LTDCSVSNLFDRVVYRAQGYQEPFSRNNGVAEAILNLDVQPSGVKDAVDEIFELGAFDIVEFKRIAINRKVLGAMAKRGFRGPDA
jgi:hypothetical protein